MFKAMKEKDSKKYEQNIFRAQIYAMNTIKKKIEIEKFEQLKLNVAKGIEVLDDMSVCSGK